MRLTTVFLRDGMRPKRLSLRSFTADETGSSLVEVAVSLTALLMFIFGIMDCSRALYAYHFTSYAARSATRYATVRGSTWGSTICATASTFQCNATAANVKTFVKAIAPAGVNTSSTTLGVATTWGGTAPTGTTGTCITTNGNNSPGCQVVVQVTYSFNFVLPFLSQTTMALTSTSKSIIMQ
jgi:Flp pilus assembly protein TadG